MAHGKWSATNASFPRSQTVHFHNFLALKLIVNEVELCVLNLNCNGKTPVISTSNEWSWVGRICWWFQSHFLQSWNWKTTNSTNFLLLFSVYKRLPSILDQKNKLSTSIINPKLARNMQMNTQDNKNHFLLKSVWMYSLNSYSTLSETTQIWAVDFGLSVVHHFSENWEQEFNILFHFCTVHY